MKQNKISTIMDVDLSKKNIICSIRNPSTKESLYFDHM
jgi:hypothetical protein